jgi:hypothetical protein
MKTFQTQNLIPFRVHYLLGLSYVARPIIALKGDKYTDRSAKVLNRCSLRL